MEKCSIIIAIDAVFFFVSERRQIVQENTVLQTTDDKQVRIWGMLCHATALIGIIGIPLGNIAGPLIIWLLKKNTNTFIDQQGKESLNFQLSMTIYALFGALLFLMKMGMFLLLLIAGINFILVVIASINALNGGSYIYPYKIQFIKK
jgi:uncharacterized Tic20 family protein